MEKTEPQATVQTKLDRDVRIAYATETGVISARLIPLAWGTTPNEFAQLKLLEALNGNITVLIGVLNRIAQQTTDKE